MTSPNFGEVAKKWT